MASLKRMEPTHARNLQREAFSQRLREALEAARIYNLADQKRFLSKLEKVSTESARKWIQGESLPESRRFPNIAEALKVDLAWLRDGIRADRQRSWPPRQQQPALPPIRAYDVEAIEDGEPAPDGYEEIEHMDFSLSAGDGSAIPTFVETKYPLYYRLDWFHRHGAKPHNVKSMGVRGDSMQRLLWDRDRVAVHIVDRTPANDHVFALILDGEACVKRLFRHGFGLRVVSDNDDKARYPDIIVEAEDMAERVSIIGRVIDKSGAGGL